MANYKTQISTISVQTSDNYATAAEALITPPSGYTTIEKIIGVDTTSSLNAAGTIRTTKFIYTIVWHD